MDDFHNYIILSEIHSGNHRVYKALRKADQNPVVIKVIGTTQEEKLYKIAKLRHEYEIGCKLQHNGIVRTYALDSYVHNTLLILEDFQGISLSQFLKKYTFNLQDFLTTAISLAETISYIHQHKIIHKDIKPSNLIIHPESLLIKITDFGISSSLHQEVQIVSNPNLLEGTLAYISPEQTGRMNRPIDYRTDLYSLGIVFYEMLTQKLPFEDTDPLELVHCHIAKLPLPPHKVNAEIPLVISEIILKLLSKSAEDRYFSAQGLTFDLQTCLSSLTLTGGIQNFVLGKRDELENFQIPEKMYGREQEIEQLMAIFQQVAQGEKKLTLVSGSSGMGKSLVVNELHKPLLENRGYFITGKFDQFNRDIPFSALIQAFRELVRQILTEDEHVLAEWKNKLLNALGDNARLIVDVIPEVELIIGVQAEVITLGLSESQHRFNALFKQFVRVFTQDTTPLVLFIDDLQWADSATLKLIELLMSATDIQSLFVIAAYRDNEVDEYHPLLQIIKGIPREYIQIRPLQLEHIAHLLSDTLQRSIAAVAALAELVLTKTAGNPFFVKSFIRDLYNHKFLYFDTEQRRWEWDIDQISSRHITDNVLELMSSEIQRLKPQTQQVLQIAACIGNHFDLEMLANIYQKSLHQTLIDIQEALDVGLILPIGETPKYLKLIPLGQTDESCEHCHFPFCFQHDQIQQAVYLSITQTNIIHLNIGRYLLQSYLSDIETYESKIFDIINHLNIAIDLIDEDSERLQLAKLNLQAAYKAKNATAYKQASKYALHGVQLLPQNAWQQQYALIYNLYLQLAENAYLLNDDALPYCEIIIANANTLLEKICAYDVTMNVAIGKGEMSQALDIGIFMLGKLGLKLPRFPNKLHIVKELIRAKSAIGLKSVEDLENLPELKDPIKLKMLSIIAAISPCAYRTNTDLLAVFVFTMLRISVSYGNAAISSYAYILYAMAMNGIMGDLKTGLSFGKLSLVIMQRFDARELKAKNSGMYNFFIRHWHESIRETFEPMLALAVNAREVGDLEYQSYNYFFYCQARFVAGDNLEQLNTESKHYLTIISSLNQEVQLRVLQILSDCVAVLCNEIPPNTSEPKTTFFVCLSEFESAIFYENFYHAIIHYLLDQIESAYAAMRRAEAKLEAVLSMSVVPLFNFYYSLILLALYRRERKTVYWRRLLKNQKRLLSWAKYAPMNQQHRVKLIQAEIAAIRGETATAISLYEAAIQLSISLKFSAEAALANELLANYYSELGSVKASRLFLSEAHQHYKQWGANLKVSWLEKRYPELNPSVIQAEIAHITAQSHGSSGNYNVLDLNTLMKSALTISGEIMLSNLLTTMMKILLESSGAQHGFVLLRRNEQWFIDAYGEADPLHVVVLQGIILDQNYNKLPMSLINYVSRTQETIVLDDATTTPQYAKDPYVIAHHPKSVLCIPIVRQGKLVCALYLENNLATHVFSKERLEVLKLLSSQVAISIDNAILYQRQSQLNAAYALFVPREFLNFLHSDDILTLKLGEQVQQEMTILFSDIRSFTGLSEKMSPQEIFDFINAYLGYVSPAIRQNNGFIIKYMGDGVMAVFPHSADDAIRGSIAKVRQVTQFNLSLKQQGKPPIHIGIGLHTGKMILGVLGESERMQADILSDSVNLASRLEGLTKYYGASIIISETTLSGLIQPELYHIRFLGKAQVKGRAKTVSLFEVFDGEDETIVQLKQQSQTCFEEGLQHFQHKEFRQAHDCFSSILQQNPEDKAALLYLKRAAQLLREGVPSDWSDIEVMTEK
ncbi:MAG: hypothetical protein RL368_778 [Pseudomonadota bacterium]